MSTQKEETRLRLLDAARTLLMKGGFHGVSLEDIAEAAGVSRQAVYKSHFASKTELLLALVEHVHVVEKLDELTAPVLAAKSGIEMLHAGIQAIVLIEVRVHDMALVLSTAALSDSAAAVAWRTRLDVKRNAMRLGLERLQADGHFNPAWKLEEAVDLLAVWISVDAYHQLVVDAGWSPEQMISRIWGICEATFVAQPGGKATKGNPKRPHRPHP
ncbi:MAG TPA: TetR/AcrR family transcriptional regulator [Polyangiaceae bacterium]|nr:TetR/AcrR family transcriptional regulator [Polyangiaceae bacterium]